LSAEIYNVGDVFTLAPSSVQNTQQPDDLNSTARSVVFIDQLARSSLSVLILVFKAIVEA